MLQEILGGPHGGEDEPTGPFAEETKILVNAKKIALMLMGVGLSEVHARDSKSSRKCWPASPM